jgi:hypothetical protein
MSETGFTTDELAESAQWENLGPEYFAARKASQAFMEKFEAEHFKPMVDQFVDAFRDKLWSDIDTFLLSDTESNLHLSMSRMVEGTVQALLSGEQWALNRYPLTKFHDGIKIRKAIAEHIGDEIARLRITELESEIVELKKRLEWERRS